jgi:CubicO group peptidase (beta-lactamase class C family)
MTLGTPLRAALLLGLLPTPALAAPNACLAEALAAAPDFSGAVLLRQAGQEHVAAQGKADVAGAALRPDSRFNLGSAAKMFTAVAVAQLIEAGKLELDAPIGRWVGGLAPPVAAVTIRQLLTHSAGLGNFFTPDSLAAMQKAKTVSQQMALIDDTAPAFPPGSQFRYSNTGFLLLGRAVEQASGEDFGAYLARHVFGTAGMTMTSLDPQTPVPAASGFTRLPEMPPGGPMPGGPMPPPGAGPMPPPGAMPPPPMGPLRPAAEAALPGTPAGGAYSTAGDMARFFDALQAGRLVSAGWVKQLTGPQIDASPPGAPVKMRYGFGFDAGEWQGRRSFGHNGGTPGVNVEAHRFPDDDVTLIVLSNHDPAMAAQRYAALRSAAFGGTLCR